MYRQFTRAQIWAFGMLALLAVLIGAYALVMYGSPAGIREQPFVTGKKGLPTIIQLNMGDGWLAIMRSPVQPLH
ncbi:hypothetical protein [Paenibacillus sp. UMB4589-SE434]|uniref:hypothetical protein n=1 Tax=Paenibacillus sp. UMB4589-SE434 TaxID=3046314 RepID=UPI002550148F|nr:hypothetical protein [Paenibacillus sp. UMB4589-SE434]MDK8184036.1 hypothetical protein [Paenibacillus sp. UMB4589-SE434]